LKGKLLQVSTLLLFSTILIILCIVQLVTKGLYIFSWDMLLISGLALLVIGMWLSLRIPQKMEDALSRLVYRGVLRTTGEGLQQFKIDLQCRTTACSRTGGLIVAMAILIAFVVAFRLPFPLEEIPLTVMEVCGGFLAGWYLGRMASYGSLGLLLKKAGIALQVKPGYLDGAAGLKPIGDFYFFQAMVAGLPALFLAVWLVLIPLWPIAGRYDRWKEPYLGLLPIALGFELLAFLVPIWFFHREMQVQKTVLLREADTLGQNIVRVQNELTELRDAQQYNLLKEQLSYMTQRYWEIERMPTWPVDMKTRRRFTLNNAVLFTIPLVSSIFDEKSVWRDLLESLGEIIKK
jgi:hypothetical protein